MMCTKSQRAEMEEYERYLNVHLSICATHAAITVAYLE